MAIRFDRSRYAERPGERSGEFFALGGIDTENEAYQRGLIEFRKRNADILERLTRGKSLSGEEKRKFFMDQVKLVENFSADNPASPKAGHLRDLRLAIADSMQLKGEDRLALEAYSSVGTPLHEYFGANHFVRWRSFNPEGKPEEPAYATADLVVPGEQPHEPYADITIPPLPEDDDKRMRYVREAATQLAGKLGLRKGGKHGPWTRL